MTDTNEVVIKPQRINQLATLVRSNLQASTTEAKLGLKHKAMASLDDARHYIECIQNEIDLLDNPAHG